MRVNFYLIQQPDRVESFVVPSINTTIKRVRERIAEQYDVDENAFYLHYRDNQVQTTIPNSFDSLFVTYTCPFLERFLPKGSRHVQHQTTQR